jgi:hypothetical protein
MAMGKKNQLSCCIIRLYFSECLVAQQIWTSAIIKYLHATYRHEGGKDMSKKTRGQTFV